MYQTLCGIFLTGVLGDANEVATRLPDLPIEFRGDLVLLG
jgi:hypothetical protein